ncbi:hypothetical protein [Limnoglobus roseus]|uniref:Uncharacterized protein n=1 Tax=Limnoglobus roseus TaxID=2598579 RepID=A0A5C1ALV9_9BACT|nr:hypothetical protein [Limnoglobus roseus]QEL19555.1 hypothetical protein PX52LOC_06631 [Limnoglobus roseus]
MLVHKISGSGSALGGTAGRADLLANPSGYKVAGLLLHNVMELDETRYYRNRHNGEMNKGERCTLLKKGRVTTNKVTGTPAVDDVAYLTSNGTLTPTVSATGGVVATPKVGQFASLKNEDGYATVDVDLPIA